jgi:hypothetical protein
MQFLNDQVRDLLAGTSTGFRTLLASNGPETSECLVDRDVVQAVADLRIDEALCPRDGLSVEAP